MPEVIFSRENPPIPTSAYDWRAGFDGREEEGSAFGPTKLAAAIALYHTTETPEDTLAAIVGILRADMEEMVATTAVSALYVGVMRIAYERAISTVEGLA